MCAACSAKKYQYPRFAVREAIVNAICHRDYRIKGRRIEVRMHDRMKSSVPVVCPATPDTRQPGRRTFSRNPRIVGSLYQWDIEELRLGN